VKLKIRVLSIVIIASKSKDKTNDIILKVVGEEIMINDTYVTFFLSFCLIVIK